jgi:hypothetical protein
MVMMSGDQSPADEMGMKLTNAYSLLESMRANLLDEKVVAETWAHRFNSALLDAHNELGALAQFAIPDSDLYTLKYGQGRESDERYIHTAKVPLMLDAAVNSMRRRLPKEAVTRIGFRTNGA